MAIIEKNSDGAPVASYTGRVMAIRETVGTVNWSDTLDYSDFRRTNVLQAFVYDPITAVHDRGLFRWVRCKVLDPNFYDHRITCSFVSVAIDASPETLAAHVRYLDATYAHERVLEDAKRQDDARKAKKAEAHVRKRAEQEAKLARAPKVGAAVRVNDFSGKVFWRGITSRNAARLGVKASDGRVLWCAVDEATVT